MKLREFLPTLADDQFIQIGTESGWLWFGTVKQAWDDLPDLSKAWFSYYLCSKANASVKWKRNPADYNKSTMMHLSNVISHWVDFLDRDVRTKTVIDELPAAGLHKSLGIKLNGQEHGIYWTLDDYMKDTEKKIKESTLNNV